MRLARVIPVLACVGVACAQIVGLEEPADLPPGTDGGSSSGSNGDATGGGPTDTTSTPDDATATPDAARGDACASAIFCESFDDEAGIADWTRKDSGSGSSSLVDNPIQSPPRAFRATNAGTGNVQLTRVIPIADAVHCEMSVRVSSWAGEGYFFELGLDPANKGGWSYWWLDVGKLAGAGLVLEYSYDGNNATNSNANYPAPPADTWFRVAIDVRLRGGAAAAHVAIDGKEVASRALAVPPSTTYQLAIGIGTDKSATADTFVIDDVMCSTP